MNLNSPELLATLMDHKGYTVRSLADQVDVDLRKTHAKRSRADSTAPNECSKSTIGNLRSGYRKRVHPDTAAAIAHRLGLPVDALFTPKVSTVYRERGGIAA
ncbi:hypothetical protein AB0E44_09170 [Micrococcus terreus]|uniref:hypothetical protein n=1 Tax=Micrococcus terreus TaxID=574650 RepID=UPI0033C03A99